MRTLTRLRTAIRDGLDKWLFQLREAERGEIQLNHRRVFIVPSRPGLGFGILLVVLFIGSVNYSLNLGFLLTFLIGGCAVVDMHLTFRNLAHLRLSAGRSLPVFVGEDARFELHLSNPGKHDRFAIWIGFIQETKTVPQTVDIAARSTCDITLSTRAVQRGWLAAPRIRLQTRFPFGLFRAWSYWRPEISTLVYPRPEDDAPPLPILGDESADGAGNGGHEDFAGVRNYQAGDSLKRLAWRQIARLDPDAGAALVTKHFEGGGAGELCIDFLRLPHTLDPELKLSRMTRWVLEAETRGLSYAFRLGAIHLPASNGPSHQATCLRALALHGIAS